FIYIAPTARLFQAAESEFHHVLYGARDHSKSVCALDYFRIRKAWEAKERVASADVVLLKKAQVRYAGCQCEELYESWRKGSIADAEVTRNAEQARPGGNGVFRAMVCGSSLSVFADPCGNSTDNCAENGIADDIPQISSNKSVELSGP